MSRQDPSAATGQQPYEQGTCGCGHLEALHVLNDKGQRRACSSSKCACRAYVAGQPDGIGHDSRDLPEVAKAVERVLAYVTEFGDGVYDVCGGAPLYGRDLEAICRAVKAVSR